MVDRCNIMKTNELETICVVGLGLLGGSLGMAVSRTMSKVRRIGYSHREVTCSRALKAGVIDECFSSVSEAVSEAQLVVLASPIGTFADLMREMADSLKEGCVVTDVGSTKVLPVRWGRKYLPKRVEFIGSHPMAGSEQRGVEFARADLFDDAQCIITPTAKTKLQTVRFMTEFWRSLGMRVSQMGPVLHDRVLARISHLPHALAAALVNCSDDKEMLLCGKGFLDTTRIASGPPSVWRDILMGNANNTAVAIGKVIRELSRMQKVLQEGNDKEITGTLTRAQEKRNKLVEKKIRRKEMPT